MGCTCRICISFAKSRGEIYVKIKTYRFSYAQKNGKTHKPIQMLHASLGGADVPGIKDIQFKVFHVRGKKQLAKARVAEHIAFATKGSFLMLFTLNRCKQV